MRIRILQCKLNEHSRCLRMLLEQYCMFFFTLSIHFVRHNYVNYANDGSERIVILFAIGQYGEVQWPHGQCACPQSKQSGFKPWLGTLLCSWARHLNLTVPLSTQEYKWVPANYWGNLTNCRGMTCNGLASCPGGVEIILAVSCYRNRG